MIVDFSPRVVGASYDELTILVVILVSHLSSVAKKLNWPILNIKSPVINDLLITDIPLTAPAEAK